MFSFLKNTFFSFFTSLNTFFNTLFSKSSLDQHDIDELERELLSNDFGYKTASIIIESIKTEAQKENLSGSKARSIMLDILKKMLFIDKIIDYNKKIHILVGVNGAGKTSTTIKLASYYKNLNQKVLVIAADTFRAAAQEQLLYAAKKYNIDCFIAENTNDPAAAVYKGLLYGQENHYDQIIIDTAGRLQTKINLMKELEKIKRIIEKIMPGDHVNSYLIIDSLLGQNSINQAIVFNEAISLNGIILTKTDSMHKPGVIFTIVHSLKIPISFVTYGEKPQDIEKFNSSVFVDKLFN
jgi:fused signal recognition particle receptor